jgi:hypothetical protein
MKFLHLKKITSTNQGLFWIVLTTLLLFGIGFFILNPLWKFYGIHVPGEPNTKVDFTFPLDSIFYIRNAELGYRWSTKVPTSIWFHPIISWLIEIMPNVIPANWRYYLISIASVPLSLFCVYKYSQKILEIRLKPGFISLAMLIPGGLNMAIGNAETLTLLFNNLILLAILDCYPFTVSFLIGITAILVKPNVLYLLAPVTVYGFYDLLAKDYKNALRCLVINLGILVGWGSWILFVDMMSGQVGAYWQAREVATVPLYAGFLTIVYRATENISLGNLGESLKYITALLIPLVDLWLILLVPFRNEKHRLASISGIILLLFISFATCNPNKIVVYIMTLPSHLIAGLVIFQLGYQSFSEKGNLLKQHDLFIKTAFILYILFSIGICAFFIIGTPFGWYI